jgi:hypothetical protein
MRILIFKFSLILLAGLLFGFWLTQYSTLNLPENIPHTPIRIGGLLLLGTLVFVLIIFEKRLLKLNPEETIFQLTTKGSLICLISETVFQLIRQLTFDTTIFTDRIYYFTIATVVITIFGIIISFLISFQLKTKRTGQLFLIIIGIMVLARLLLPLLGYKIN